MHIAGITSAILAAIPGIIDYHYTVPPKSSAKTRSAKHGLLNTAVVLLFTIALILKLNDHSTWPLALEVPAILLMLSAEWMGGTLVHRNLIGVDIRYAGAGKWKEFYTQQQEGLIKIAYLEELNTDQMKLCHIGVKRIALAKAGSGFVAFDDRCSHRGGSLTSGMMICNTVQCPWHGSQFDTRNGDVKAGPAKEKITTYQLVIKENKVYINLSKTN